MLTAHLVGLWLSMQWDIDGTTMPPIGLDSPYYEEMWRAFYTHDSIVGL